MRALLPAVLCCLAACSAAEAPPRPSWDRTLPATGTLGQGPARRGLRVVRGIIHLHSVYSHDACDNDPQPGGAPNAPCAASLRRGLCQTRQDFAMLTDHAVRMAQTPWERLFVMEAGDQAVMEGGGQTGSLLSCDAASGAPGQAVLITVGGENALMPVGLTRHLGDTEEERRRNMNADDAMAVARFRAAGGVVLLPHGESRSIEVVRALAQAGLGGMEIYNLHANVDPRIRTQWLGLDGLGAAAGLSPWLVGGAPSEGGPEPDLAALGFLEENRNQLGKYDTLLGEGHRLSPVLGSDIHENTFKQALADGERGDSYRRLMRWFGNHLLVPQGAPLTPALLKEALAAGRVYGVFELFGPPAGFDYYADAGMAGELGGTVRPGTTLHLVAPDLGLPPGLPDLPELRLRILYIGSAAAPVEVAAQTVRAGAGGALRHVAARPGAYRAEIRIVPHHLLPLLGRDADLARYRREYPYLYTAPIYVAAP
jgi:hypothetical protein